jgi:hypothetical protein
MLGGRFGITCSQQVFDVVTNDYTEPLWLQSSATDSFQSSGSGSPFYSQGFVEQNGVNLNQFSTTATSNIRIYKKLSTNVLIKHIKITNFYNKTYNQPTLVDTNKGVRNIVMYLTTTDPTTTFNANVSTANMIYQSSSQGEIPVNHGSYDSSFNRVFPATTATFHPVYQEIVGRYIVMDIINNWGSPSGTAVSRIDIACSIPTNVVALTMPITCRYIKIKRIDNENQLIHFSGIKIYNMSDAELSMSSGTVSPTPKNNDNAFNWDKLFDNNNTTYASTTGTSTDYIQLDLGSMIEVKKIKLFSRGYPSLQPATFLTTNMGCVVEVLDNSLESLGMYTIQDFRDYYAIGFAPVISRSIDTWLTTIGTEPATLALKWDCKEQSLVRTNGSYVTNSNQYITQWQESTRGSGWNFDIYDYYGYSRFEVDSDGQPSISMPYGSSFMTSDSRIVYPNRTYFIVMQLQTSSKYGHRPFNAGNGWNYWQTDGQFASSSPDWYFAVFEGFSLEGSNAYFVYDSLSRSADVVPDTSDVLNKRVVIGFKIEVINSTNCRIVFIRSDAPSTIKYTPNLTKNASEDLTVENTAANTYRWTINGRYRGSTTFDQYSSILAGETYWKSGSLKFYELNVHEQLTEAQMITECGRLMTKWNVIS